MCVYNTNDQYFIILLLYFYYYLCYIYILYIITVTERRSPPLGKKEFNKIIKSTARITSQFILQMANL